MHRAAFVTRDEHGGCFTGELWSEDASGYEYGRWIHGKPHGMARRRTKREDVVGWVCTFRHALFGLPR